MSHQEILYQDSISKRRLPINFSRADAGLFEHELEKHIPATVLLCLEDVAINPAGVLFRGSKILSQSFPSPILVDTWTWKKTKLKLLIDYLFKPHKTIEGVVYWFTDTWSQEYFHWMTDALPRLLTIRERAEDVTFLLPETYAGSEYIVSSLKPFSIRNLRFIHNEILIVKNLKVPSRTAPTGNYNESVIRNLRHLYVNFYRTARRGRAENRIYVSRGKAQKRKIANEEECVATLKEYGFNTIYFEDYPFEQQVEIALNTQYLISIHGAGLTNMLFMNPGGNVLELRKNGDTHSNCYFSLASALHLNYYYQLCESENPDEDAHTANLVVDCQLLRKNVEQMLAK